VDTQPRLERLTSDREALAALAAASSIFTCEASGDPPDRYTLTFRGKGLARDASSAADITTIDLHQIDLRMPYSYPSSPPDIRWLTPVWHPSVSFSGFVNLADVGLVWSKDLPIDVVCERLWDVARGAFFNPDRVANFAAKNWYEKECTFTLPVDSRPLGDRMAAAAGSNIVRYQRRGGSAVQFAGVPASNEVIFIDENTPTPMLPQRQPYIPISRRRGNSDDVLYIGPE
jgi:hypothetical protein